MVASDVIDMCKARGVVLTVAGDRLRVRAPAGAVDDDLRDRLREMKLALVAVITAVCPNCHQPVDERRRCWKCHDRSCEACGRPTGSAFLATCCACDLTGTPTRP